MILKIKSLLKQEIKCVTRTAELRSQNVGVKCIGDCDNLNHTLKIHNFKTINPKIIILVLKFTLKCALSNYAIGYLFFKF